MRAHSSRTFRPCDSQRVSLGELSAGLRYTTLCLLTYPLNDTHSITRLPRPDDQQTRILQALQVALPRREM